MHRPSCQLKLIEFGFHPGGGGGGCIFSYIQVRRLGPFSGVQNFEFQYFWRFQKNEYFWGMKILCIFYCGHHKIGLYLGVISMYLWFFS